MRATFFASLASAFASLAVLACDGDIGNGNNNSHPPGGPPDACVGIGCMQMACTGGATTSVSGTVYAPNGTLPLYGVNVYVPLNDPPPFTDGVTCDQCSSSLPGYPIVKTVTDEAGHFQLDNVPVVDDLPLVISVGKWRKYIKIATVTKCQDNLLTSADTTLPRSYAEAGQGNVVSVSMPKIAITTGSADALECLVRKLGIADAEISTDAGSGHVHLYAGNGANKFASGWAGGSGQSFTSATQLWNDVNQLKKYDVVIFSCEGNQDADTPKPQSAMQAVYDYANVGGRIFLSHWHNIWLEGNTQTSTPPTNVPPGPWPTIAQFTDSGNPGSNSVIGVVDESFNHGSSFATWLLNVGASTVRDQLPINDWRNTCASVDPAKAERWVYLDQAISGATGVQNFQFTTPNDADPTARCGKVAFSDMHVSSGSSSDPGTPYPGGCASGDLTPQEKALAFMFFDIASCVSNIP
jgi:hypothetical protein